MDRFLEESLRSANDRHASTLQWSLILLSLLLLAHVLFFTRFLQVRQSIRSADEQERVLASLKSDSDRLAKSHAELNDLVSQETSRITRTEIVDHTAEAFRALNGRVFPLLDAKRLDISIPAVPSLPPIPGSGIPVSEPLGTSGSDLRGDAAFPGPPGIGSLRPEVLQADRPPLPIPGSFPAIQLPPEAISGGQPPFPLIPGPVPLSIELPSFDASLEQSLRNAGSMSEVREALAGYVNQVIVEPNFSAANLQIQQFIQNRVLPKLSENLQQLDELQRQTETLTNTLRSNVAIVWPDWQKMKSTVALTIEHAKQLRFEPPENDHWWRSVAQKERTASVLAMDAMFAMRPQVGPDLDRLTGMLQQMRSDQERARQQLEQQMKSVEESFAHFQQTAKSLDASLSVAFLDLESFVLGFPFIVAIAFSTVVVATGHRLRSLKIIHRLVSESMPQAESWKQALGLVGLDRAALRRSTMAMGTVGLLWIMIVVAQLYFQVGWSGRDTATVVFSIGLIVSACVVRYQMLARC